jgi:glycine cleavage system H protein
MNIPENLKYTKEHEWVRIDGSFGFVGITDFAQSELGDIVFVDLPQVGASMTKGSTFGTIEAVKAVSDLYAPVSGEVVEVNTTVADTPEVVNKDPYGEGWMLKVKIKDAADVSQLLDAAAYKALTGT